MIAETWRLKNFPIASFVILVCRLINKIAESLAATISARLDALSSSMWDSSQLSAQVRVIRFAVVFCSDVFMVSVPLMFLLVARIGRSP